MYGREIESTGDFVLIDFVIVEYQHKENNIVDYNTELLLDDDSVRLNKDAIINGYDLVTTYHILRERTSCFNINEGFPKRAVIDTLEDMKRRYDEGQNIGYANSGIYEEFDRPMYDFLVYLKCNAAIMGINFKTEGEISINPSDDGRMEIFDKKIQALIDQYYARVRKYLDNIDDTTFVNYSFKYVVGS
jgi:hypothetical protein